MKPSKEQNVVFNTFYKKGKNVLIRAVAGSGKTTILVAIAKYFDSNGIYLCFNKSIKEEIDKKLVEKGIGNLTCFTMHSIGMRTINSNSNGVKSFFNKNGFIKGEIIKDKGFLNSTKTLTKGNRWYILNSIESIFDFARYNGSLDYEVGLKAFQMAGGALNNLSNKVDFKEVYDMFVDYYKSLTFLQGNKFEIDFGDMIFLPVYLNMQFSMSCKYILVDEAQDFNILQHLFLKKIFVESGASKIAIVGDPQQSIYGFCGASPIAFNKFLEYPNIVELTLSTNYRCGTNIINNANKVYNNLTAGVNFPGEVREIYDLNDISNSSLVITRKVSTIFKAFFILLSHNRPVSVKGENLLGAIKAIVFNYRPKQIGDILTAAVEELDFKQSVGASGSEIFKVKEEIEILKLLVVYGGGATKDKYTLVKEIEKIIEQEPADYITLCTIHKAKGLEADEVTLINESDIPIKNATTGFELEQEENLRYVALTRAKLIFNLIKI